MDLKINWYTERLRQAAALRPTCLYSSVSAVRRFEACLPTATGNPCANVCCCFEISNNFQNGVISDSSVYSSLGNT